MPKITGLLTLQKTTKASAEFFASQCHGDYKGHMSRVPFNPTLHAFCETHNVNYMNFPEFLRQMADALESTDEPTTNDKEKL